jgi:hypothetical protein
MHGGCCLKISLQPKKARKCIESASKVMGTRAHLKTKVMEFANERLGYPKSWARPVSPASRWLRGSSVPMLAALSHIHKM